MMKMHVEIDLNVRINGNHTYTYEDPAYVAQFEVGSAYVVGESESGLTFPATLVAKRNDGYMEFEVAWEKGGAHGD